MAPRLIVLTFLIALVNSRPVSAQDRAVVFLHGFASSGATWYDTATRLGAFLKLTPLVAELPWPETFDSQATYLNGLANNYGAPADMVAVGHSNGGLVARQLSTKRPLGGVVTVGSPHLGAPLIRGLGYAATHYGNAANDLGTLLYLVGATTPGKYSGAWFSPGMAPVRSIVASLGVALRQVDIAIYWAAGAVFTTPVARDMAPGSAALNALNSPGNLAREAAVVPRRAGLIFAAREWWVGAPFVGMFPAWQQSGDLAVKAAIPILWSIANYFTPPNVSPLDAEARYIRQTTERLAYNLLQFNSVWCTATSGAPDCSISTDGIVPTESQFYPGAASNFGYYGPAHVQQTSQAEPMIRSALADAIGLEPRGTGGGSGGGGGGGGGQQSWSLSPGERLYPDTEIRSPNGQYALRFQSDGNLVLYGPSGPVWASQTGGRGGLFAEMQVDGNLVVYLTDGGEPWASGTAGMAGAELQVQDDGFIVMYDLARNVIWYAPQ